MPTTRLLFAAAHCLLDRTSGAAITVQALLAGLARRGVSVRTLEAACFDAPAGQAVLPLRRPARSGNGQILPLRRQGIHHNLMVFSTASRVGLTGLDEVGFEAAYRLLLARFRPHVLLTYGGLALERVLLREARLRGVRTVFYLANPTYNVPDGMRCFRDVDRLVSDTVATASLYRRSLGLIAEPIGLFIDPERVRAQLLQPETVTFVNPVPDKGVGLVIGLAQLCLERLPEARFLVVESRGQWQPALAALGLSPADLPNVEVWPHQHDMRAVYGRSRVVLMPSYWHESAGMVALEALINGIPVLASDHGGLGEILQGGAELLHIPPPLRASGGAIPPLAVLEPWLAALTRLLRQPQAYRQACERAQSVGTRYGSEAGVNRMLELLEELRVSA